MKKIAVNTVKAFLQEHKREDAYTQTFTMGDSSFEVAFHTALTVSEKTTFINRVISGCFDSTGKFRPEYVSPMLRATIMQMCTNLPPLTLKNETDDEGAAALDLNGMNELYLALNLDAVQNEGYQAMLGEMVALCTQAIDWKKGCTLSGNTTENALRDLIVALTTKVDSLNVSDLMQFAGDLSVATKGLDEGGILQGLLKLHEGKKE